MKTKNTLFNDYNKDFFVQIYYVLLEHRAK